MPNGGSDCCGECAFNARSLVRHPDLAPGDPGWCEIRELPLLVPFWTYCANFHTGSPQPDGPVFAGFHEWGRLPWHGSRMPEQAIADVPCGECGRAPTSLVVADGDRTLRFCIGDHYLAWWRTMHPGETGEYRWELHEAMVDPRRRAEGRDRPRGLREWLLWLLRR